MKSSSDRTVAVLQAFAGAPASLCAAEVAADICGGEGGGPDLDSGGSGRACPQRGEHEQRSDEAAEPGTVTGAQWLVPLRLRTTRGLHSVGGSFHPFMPAQGHEPR